ncbi:hypothetical protein JCGZ_19385 [Jatropha curcas]|uniref:Uncharacterized protein n=1 Tax=Jatropha curcas TaxID=180498 RepID=A0A067KCL6_JATCU|nr:hypothetical protein JCGZ_19385 [Jatropha curcas]
MKKVEKGRWHSKVDEGDEDKDEEGKVKWKSRESSKTFSVKMDGEIRVMTIADLSSSFKILDLGSKATRIKETTKLDEYKKEEFIRKSLRKVQLDQRPFGKFTESMPIWYLKRPKNYEDRRTGPGIFFGGTELPKKPLERKTSEWTAATVRGSSARPPRLQLPPSTAAIPALQPGFSYKYSPDSDNSRRLRHRSPPSTAAAAALQPGFSYKYSPESTVLGLSLC